MNPFVNDKKGVFTHLVKEQIKSLDVDSAMPIDVHDRDMRIVRATVSQVSGVLNARFKVRRGVDGTIWVMRIK